MGNLMKTIKQIYNCNEIKLTKESSSVEIWYNELINKHEDEVDIHDILRMIRQQLFLDLDVKKAIPVLKNDIAAGEYYDYELIEHLASVDKQ